MEKQLATLNADGNQIISRSVDGSGELQTIKYGIIRLMGDKNEYRVSFKTLCDIEKMRNAGFTGSIKITELNMSVMANQIVMAKSETEDIRIVEHFTNRPTSTVILDKDMKISNHTKNWFIRNNEGYYLATCHYVEVDGQRQYMLQREKIKKLVKIEIEEGYEVVISIEEYGIIK